MDTGSIVGAWVVEALLGEGGIGQVWRVRNRHAPEIVRALKVIHPAFLAAPGLGDEVRRRMLREDDRKAGP